MDEDDSGDPVSSVFIVSISISISIDDICISIISTMIITSINSSSTFTNGRGRLGGSRVRRVHHQLPQGAGTGTDGPPDDDETLTYIIKRS